MKSTLTSMPLEMQQALKRRRMHCEWASPPAKSWFNSVIFIHIQGTVVHSCEEEVVPVCARSSDWLSTYWNNQANREPKNSSRAWLYQTKHVCSWSRIRVACDTDGLPRMQNRRCCPSSSWQPRMSHGRKCFQAPGGCVWFDDVSVGLLIHKQQGTLPNLVTW